MSILYLYCINNIIDKYMTSLGGAPTDNNKGLSALEKAKLIKEQKEKERQAEATLSKEQEEARQRELDEKYLVDKAALAKLKAEKDEVELGVKDTREARKENILGQRAAIKEMIGSGSDEDVELFKETKKDIFSEDDEKLKADKSKEKELKSKSKSLEENISSQEKDLESNFENSSEGKRIREKEKAEADKEKLNQLRKNLENLLGKSVEEKNLIPTLNKVIEENKKTINYLESDAGSIDGAFDKLVEFAKEKGVLDSVVARDKDGRTILLEVEENVIRINNEYAKISGLEKEKRELEDQIRHSALGFGNSKRKDRIKEIDEHLNNVDKKALNEDWTNNVAKKSNDFDQALRMIGGSENGLPMGQRSKAVDDIRYFSSSNNRSLKSILDESKSKLQEKYKKDLEDKKIELDKLLDIQNQVSELTN